MTTRNRWPMLRILLTAHVSFGMMVWLGLAAVSALVTAGIAIFGTVEYSIWYTVCTQALRWFLLGIGFDAMNTYLRMHVAHGRTRRDFLRQLWPYVVVLSTVAGLLATVGYLVESVAYAAAGWPQGLPAGLLFAEATSVGTIFWSYTVIFLLWTVGGVLLGAAFTRATVVGVVSIPLALLVIVPGGLLLRGNELPFVTGLSHQLELPVVTLVGMAAVAVLLASGAIWLISRDMPMRPKVT